MNTVNLIGNLGRDPKINTAGTMASFSIAVKNKFRNKQTNEYETNWFNCKAFGKTAELIRDNFFKGSQIAFEGHLQNNNYEKDGKMIYRDEVIVDAITFIGQKNHDTSSEHDSGVNTTNYNSNQNTGTNQSQNGSYDPFASDGNPIDIEDDDLPF